MRFFAVFVALVGIVCAAVDPSDPCATKQIDRDFNLTISTQDDLDGISSCTKIGSNLIIDKNFPGNADFSKIISVEGSIKAGDVDTLISGSSEDVEIEKSALTGLSFPSLVVANKLQVVGLRDLQSLDFPAIKEVSSEIDLFHLPSLVTWTGFESLNYSARTYIVNTGLSELLWNSSDSRHPITGTIYISNNTALDLIVLTNPKDVDQYTINGNGNTEISLGIETVRHLTVTGCSGYATSWNGLGDGFNDLENVTGLYQPDGWIRIWNNSFKMIDFMQLRNVAGSIEIHDNPNLVNLSMTEVWEIDGQLMVTNNDALKVIGPIDFMNLETVVGNVNFTGAFEDIELSQRLNVTYSFEIKAAGNVSCAQFDWRYELGYFASGDPYSTYACAANGDPIVYQSIATGSGSSDSGASKRKGGLSRAAFWAIVIAIPVPLGLAFWSFVIWWLCRRHKKKKETKAFNDQTMANVPAQPGAIPVQYYGAPPAENSNGPMQQQPQQQQPHAVVPDRKPLAVAGVQNINNDQASSLTVGEQNHGVLSTHSSISRDSRNPTDLERREEELLERERMIEDMERERRAEELNAREMALAEREREIQAWNENRNSGHLP